MTGIVEMGFYWRRPWRPVISFWLIANFSNRRLRDEHGGPRRQAGPLTGRAENN